MTPLEQYVRTGFDKIRREQGITQEDRDLAKSLAAIRRHYGIDTEAGRERLHKSVEDDSEYAQQHLQHARKRSYTTTHDEGLEDVPEDTGPQFGGEVPVDGPEFQPLAWRVAAREQAILQAEVSAAQDRINEETRRNMRRPRQSQPESRRSR